MRDKTRRVLRRDEIIARHFSSQQVPAARFTNEYVSLDTMAPKNWVFSHITAAQKRSHYTLARNFTPNGRWSKLVVVRRSHDALNASLLRYNILRNILNFLTHIVFCLVLLSFCFSRATLFIVIRQQFLPFDEQQEIFCVITVVIIINIISVVLAIFTYLLNIGWTCQSACQHVETAILQRPL